jgi:TetR/AcrR family tetracycline transcriptional repressor
VTAPPVTKPARGSLARDQIVDAAIQLVDTHGPSALSTRRLGRALGVAGMAIYWHLPNMDALMDAMLEKIWDGVYENPTARPDEWVAHMRRVMESIRQVGLDHPQVFGLLAVRPAPDRLQRMAGVNIALLQRAGFSDELAQYAIHTLFGHVFWNVLGEVRGYYGTPMRQARGSLVRRNRLFGPGLDIILTGLQTLVARQRKSATELLSRGLLTDET